MTKSKTKNTDHCSVNDQYFSQKWSYVVSIFLVLGLLSSQTPCILLFIDLRLTYFSAFLCLFLLQQDFAKYKKWPANGEITLNLRNKLTLLPQTLKVEIAKW